MAFDGFIKIKFMEIKMSHVLISHIAMNASGDFPSETVRLNYGKILWTYTQQNRQGGNTMGNVAAGWDRRRNCPA